ncbi:MAG: DNA ligase, partial [Planctomycetes bacterium]|nr:DNA ligase [Planctomycetota bacterium]
GLPKVPLDGELWIDRKAFQKTVSIVRRQDKNLQWESVRYLVFDAPAMTTPFEERIQFLVEQYRAWKNEYVQLHDHQVCKGISHLREELSRIKELGGEGLMLRQPGSSYVAGRSSTLLKVKTFHDDEATVIGHEPGKGRHKGRLGALLVKLSNGKEFSVGTGFSDKQRESPPVVGSLIQFRYQELSDAGIPRFPSFVGQRLDIDTSNVGTSKVDTSTTVMAKSSSKSVAKKPDVTKKPAERIVVSEASNNVAPRYFELVEGASSKFWEIKLDGSDVTTRWGRIGTDGQSKTKSFASPDKAQVEYDKLLKEKTGKGYIAVTLVSNP